jgi:hypothetical protein
LEKCVDCESNRVIWGSEEVMDLAGESRGSTLAAEEAPFSIGRERITIWGASKTI